MRVYSITAIGKELVRNRYEDTDEFRVLTHLRDYKTATDDELEVVGGRYTTRQLKERGLIRELTK